MKKEVADKWIAELRSGNYEQGTHGLCVLETHSKDDRLVKKGHCCLGVLCELAIKEGESVTKFQSSDPHYMKYNGEVGTLPPEIMSWAGMKSVIGEVSKDIDIDDDEARDSLAEYNDAGKTFAEIADIIEKHWEVL